MQQSITNLELLTKLNILKFNIIIIKPFKIFEEVEAIVVTMSSANDVLKARYTSIAVLLFFGRGTTSILKL